MSGHTDQPKKRAAQRAEQALEKAGARRGFRACAKKLAGVPYVVIHEIEGDVRRAYTVASIDLVAVRAKDWNYPAWRAAVKPEERVEVAVAYFAANERRGLTGGDGRPILGEEQCAALASLLDGKAPEPDLRPEQIEVLEIAKRLGLAGDTR